MAWTKKEQRILWLIGGVYFLLGLAYLWATPPLDASDEYKHYPVVQHIQTTASLPVLDPADPGLWYNEAAQPPLYYLLMAAATWPLDTADLPSLHQMNTHFFVGNPLQLHNKNIMLPPVDRGLWRESGTVQAIYWVRLLSLCLGLGTIWATAVLARQFLHPTAAIAAAGLVAFNPMFIFISAAVNNDSLTVLLSSIGLGLLIELWRNPPDPRQAWWPYVRLGILCGLALLTKASLAALLLLAGIILAVRAWQWGRWSLLFGGGVMIFVVAMAFWSPLLWRNWQLYGDVTALNVFIAVQGTRPDQSLAGVDWVGEFGTFYRNFWGQFGGVNINAPEWYYQIANTWLLLGVAGWVVRLLVVGVQEGHTAVSLRLRQLWENGGWLLLLQILIIMLLLIRWTIVYYSFQGRLLFPALAGITVLWAGGLWQWAELAKRGHTAVVTAPVLFFALVAGWLPFALIQPNYELPQPLTAVPADYQFGPIQFNSATGEQLLLVGVEPHPELLSTTPGDPYGVDITLYWTIPQATNEDFVTSVHTLGRELTSVGQSDRYPGWGLWPTSRWQPGEIYRDTYRVQVWPDAVAPSRLLLTLGALAPLTSTVGITLSHTAVMTPTAPDGTPIPLVIIGEARLAADPPAPADPQHRLDTAFADGILLRGYDQANTAVAGQPVDITLHWQATGTPSQPYTIFFQLLDPQQNYLLGADSPPLNGDYPTHFWRAGDHIRETRQLQLPAALPPGDYTIAVGLYDPATGARLPLLSPASGDALTWQLPISR
jgi:4-amino-4-deoxy-L-arabinose transferase-like glycosyltransferase